MDTGNEHIKVEKKKEIGIITLNRPEARNALNRKMIQELGDVLTGLENDPQIRSIIITGNKTEIYFRLAEFCTFACYSYITGKG